MKVIHNMSIVVDKLEKRIGFQEIFEGVKSNLWLCKAIKTNRLRFERLVVNVKSRIEEVD